MPWTLFQAPFLSASLWQIHTPNTNGVEVIQTTLCEIGPCVSLRGMIETTQSALRGLFQHRGDAMADMKDLHVLSPEDRDKLKHQPSKRYPTGKRNEGSKQITALVHAKASPLSLERMSSSDFHL